MERITHFAYEHEFLSNFHRFAVVWDGDLFSTVEHAYQASKTLDPKLRETFTLKFNPRLSPGQAKRIGQSLELRDDWDRVKVPVMRGLLLQKFGDPVMREKLLKTGDAYLEEGNWWHDVFWGVCYHKMEGKVCKKPPHEPFGGNHLGYLLMEVRSRAARGV